MKKCKYCMSEIDDKAKICPHCGKRQKRSVIKTILSCIFLLFAVLVIIAIATGGSDKDETGIMTMDKFNAIQNGMTYEEVVEIVGGERNICLDKCPCRNNRNLKEITEIDFGNYPKFS